MTDPARPTVPPATSELDQLPDRDSEETSEWRASLDAVVRHAGRERAVYLLRRVHEYAARAGISLPTLLSTDYINTVPASAQPAFPGDLAMETRITAVNRWNAAAMVTRGARLGLGGHLSTYASAAWLYEIGFNHFFRGKDRDGSGDQLYLQGHASPGIYARVFLEGRLSERQLDGFRREADGHGLWVRDEAGILRKHSETFWMWPASRTKVIEELEGSGFAPLPERADPAVPAVRLRQR